MPADGPIQCSWRTRDGATRLQAMRKNRMEGVVAKRPGASYAAGNRSDAWLEIKTPTTKWEPATRVLEVAIDTACAISSF